MGGRRRQRSDFYGHRCLEAAPGTQDAATSVVAETVPLRVSMPLSTPELSPHKRHNVEPSATMPSMPSATTNVLPHGGEGCSDPGPLDSADGLPISFWVSAAC